MLERENWGENPRIVPGEVLHSLRNWKYTDCGGREIGELVGEKVKFKDAFDFNSYMTHRFDLK